MGSGFTDQFQVAQSGIIGFQAGLESRLIETI
jgi:hypothetical protein